jgi:hypothetical protein
MTWNAIAAIAEGEQSDGLYPTLASGLSFEREPFDGPLPAPIDAIAIEVEHLINQQWHRSAHADDLKLQIYPTAGRLVIYCHKWSTGGFIGTTGPIGLAVAMTTAAISGAVAAKHNKGRALAGHVRWEWVTSVGWQARTFWKRNAVVLRVLDSTSGTQVPCRITIFFKGTTDERAVAHSFAKRAVAYRLASNEAFDDEEHSAWEELQRSQHWTEPNKGFSRLDFPTGWPVGSKGFIPPETTLA